MRPRAALAVLAILTVAHTWPLSMAPWRLSLNHHADAQQGAWTLSWIAHTLVRDPAHLFDGNIFAPDRATLTYSDPVIMPAVIGAPVYWLSGSPVLTFNVTILVGLLLTAWTTWRLATDWTGSPGAGLVAGALAAFNVHTLTRLPHLIAAHLWTVPLSLWLADRLIDRARRRDAMALALVVLATTATSFYNLALVGLVVLAAIVSACVMGRWRAAVTIGASAAGGVMLATPILLPYARMAARGEAWPLEIVAQFAATPLGYLVTPSLLHAGWSARLFDGNPVNVMFAGVTALVLTPLGLRGLWREDAVARRRVLMVSALAAAGIVLSWGPATVVYRSLYAWMLPLRALRAVARFGYLWLLAVAIFAAAGVASLERRQAVAGRRRRRWLLAPAALLLVTVEVWQAPIRTTPFTGVPAIYQSLAAERGLVTLVEVPFYPPETAFENGEYELNATAHWRPLMNGTSGYLPDSYRRRTAAFWSFPEDWAIDTMRREGATHVMVHLERFGGDAAEIERTLAARTDLWLLASDAVGHRLYRLTR